MTTVFISKAAYDSTLTRMVHDLLESTVKDRVFPGARVLIKPNLLLPAKPSTAILTHPLVVRAVAEWVLEKGGNVQVSDSPGIGPFNRVLREGGYLDACRGLQIDWRTFTHPKQVDIGPPFGRIDLAADPLEADFVINLAKLKSHVMMRLTLGIKNMFGCVIGIKKTQWHLQAGVDRDLFAKLLVQICYAVSPGVTLVDGILALEGQGPGRSGSPRHVGILGASRDPAALDFAVSRLVGCRPETVPTHRAAVALGYFTGPPSIVGDTVHVDGFLLPELGSTGFGPEPIQKLMRRHLLQRPAVNKTLCRACGICGKKCPAEAITTLSDRISIDYDRCIRCYCCVEVCPHGALFTADPLAGRMFRQLENWTNQALDRIRFGKRRK